MTPMTPTQVPPQPSAQAPGQLPQAPLPAPQPAPTAESWQHVPPYPMPIAAPYLPQYEPPRQAYAGPTYGQRLALAITSVVTFLFLVALAMGAAAAFDVGFLGWIAGIFVLGLTVVAVNVVFAWAGPRTRG